MSLTFYKVTTAILTVGIVLLAAVCVFDMFVISQQRLLIVDMYKYIQAACPISY
jgi:hypothetical protein